MLFLGPVKQWTRPRGCSFSSSGLTQFLLETTQPCYFGVFPYPTMAHGTRCWRDFWGWGSALGRLMFSNNFVSEGMGDLAANMSSFTTALKQVHELVSLLV